jgi:hypothetical protein
MKKNPADRGRGSGPLVVKRKLEERWFRRQKGGGKAEV